ISMERDGAKKRRRGRPRAFDRDEVLDAAVMVFWEKGYEGASIDNLTEAMGIQRPSLYATFGSKRDLFVEAIDRYAATHGRGSFDPLRNDPDTKSAVAAFFDTNIRRATERGKPRGCLIACVATETAETDVTLRQTLFGMYSRADASIAERFRANQEEGSFPAEHDPDALARMVHSVIHSIRVRARAGATRKELTAIADDFMTVLFPASN
ncbi:MAG: TetR/AcrR family transcriptional regulator, partial [Gaiellaceae bacterium]